MPEYQEYPAYMTHPAFQPAVLSDDASLRRPMKFPPVQVPDKQMEEYHAAQGYVRSGKPNPRAFESTRATGPASTYVHQDYPKWVNGVLCNTEEAERALFPASVPEVPQPSFNLLKAAARPAA